MMKGLVVDETMSNLTSASSEISASSGTMNPHHSSTSTNQEPHQPKKKRSLPGHPDPEAEVIALSPKTLLTTNRFICEVCNKGFQRDQNLQLHRRGHNLPWKLKQRSNKDIIRKKVYVCPEITCVHHDPSRALGDLTGIKKHFCRKHGEKKWKCDKCSKRYAVQSDWKAHSKICGTKEYKCDCGTLFSRRDSFITHRAFCDALAQESARAVTAVNPLLHTHHPFQPPLKKEHEFLPWLGDPAGLTSLRPLSSSTSSSSLLPAVPTHLDQSLNFIQNSNPTATPPISLFQSAASPPSPYMSATALLQQASQMGHMPHSDHHQCTTSAVPNSATSLSSAVSGLRMPSRDAIGFPHALASYGNKAAAFSSDYLEHNAVVSAICNNTASPPNTATATATSSVFHDMMGSTVALSSGFERSSFEEAFRGMLNNNPTRDHTEFQFSKSNKATLPNHTDNEMTRDFLGLKAFSQRDFFDMSGLDHLGSSSYGGGVSRFGGNTGELRERKNSSYDILLSRYKGFFCL